jgi:hypothetical protein
MKTRLLGSLVVFLKQRLRSMRLSANQLITESIMPLSEDEKALIKAQIDICASERGAVFNLFKEAALEMEAEAAKSTRKRD